MKLSDLGIEETWTSKYPTRYVAFDNPGKWVTQTRQENWGGFEYAVYHETMVNEKDPEITDGIHLEIVSYQGKGYLLEANAFRPDASRAQMGVLSEMFYTMDAAKQAAIAWIKEARKFCATVTN